MKNDLIDELISINTEKLKLLNIMLDLTKEQKEAIENDDVDKVNGILDGKDELIKKIDSLDVKFMMKFSEFKKKNNIKDLNELNPSEYPNLKGLKSVVEEITSTLMAISILDEGNTKSLKDDMEKVKANLKNIKKGQKAYKGYNKIVKESIFIDEKK